MKIAFTTEDSVHINAHFGWAKRIDVYDVTPDGYTLLENLVFTGDLKEDGNEDKLVPKLKALSDCTIVYVADIGPGAAARLINKNITPIKAPSEEMEITDLLERLVVTLQGTPPPWLRKALRQAQPPKLDADYVETEEEITV
ncbi:nitrogen fixation protein NifX [Trichothermofontia sichuanensis B231]|uniref:nitrogen fixation protein NifX n=1 Tax=Trichothermofontia sichuanensis TaxID=3045816 RepID=UPI0022485ED2|nr:nitrogen fixation protein NifX [Trichothermofontia sichuanensis]UZQ54285.1 nitrogen fixation protein NifX [Trichothermofontia sichuanensis B231]